jgi:DNA-binding CsgD family transcriptional regulator
VDVGAAYLHLAELLTGPLGELDAGVAVAREGAGRAEQLGLGRTYGTRLLAVAANGLFRAGRWAEAEQAIAAALRHRPSGTDAVELLLSRCRISVGYGDLDGAERDLEAVETLLAGGPARYVLPLLTLRAGLAMWRGEYAGARRAVQQALGPAADRSDDVWLLAPVVWHGLRAEAEAHANGTDGPDPEAVELLRRVAGRIATAALTAARPVRETVAGYQALCEAEITRLEGRPDPGAWAGAAEIWERRGQPYPAAYARLRQADALYSHRTRNAEAAAALRAAHDTAYRLGAQPFIREIIALAHRARVPLDDPGRPAATPAVAPAPRQPDDELSGLTERELQVLAEVAAGRTNHEIADLLFISQRTVGVHVSRILHKLRVRTRVQAASVYMRSQPPGS